MKRRDILSGAALGLGAAAAAAALSACGKKDDTAVAGAADTKTYTWKLVTTWPKNYPGLGMAPENLAKRVEAMSNGRLKIKVYGAGELVPAMEIFDAVSQGTAEMGHGAAYYWKGKHPAAQFFTAVPFGLNAQEMWGWLHYGGGMELWRKLYAPFNLVPFAGGSTGVQMAGWFNKEIKSVADIKGLKMRIPGLAGEVWTRLGGTAVTLPGGELFTALQTGVIDATEWVGPYNDLTFGFYKITKFYYYPGWHEPGSILEFTVNKSAWESLPPDLQSVLENAMRAVNQDMLDEYTARNEQALDELVNKHGVKVLPLPDDVLSELRRVSDEVVSEIQKHDAAAKEIFDSYVKFRGNAAKYLKISEQAYLEAREKTGG
jgi:TRAP-type mannitol/chloroaromatic compound transport system substrate-binding protein